MARKHLSEIELTEYADGEMAPAKSGPVEGHLRECDACAAALAESRQAAAGLARLHAVPIASDLRDRVLARLAPERGRTLSCRQAAPLLHEYVDRCLPPLLMEPLRRHLASCGGCRATCSHLAGAVHLVSSLALVGAPAVLRDRVMARGRARLRPAPLAGWRPALAGAGVAVTAGLVLLLRVTSQPTPQMHATGSTGMGTPALQAGSLAPGPALRPVSPPIAVAEVEPGAQGQPEDPTHASPPALPRIGERARAGERGLRMIALAASPGDAVVSGPSAAKTTVVAVVPAVLPAAVRALKAVAERADYDLQAQPLGLAAERYSTLSSEEMLERWPEAVNPESGAAGAAGPAAAGTPAATPPTPPAKAGLPGRDSASNPDAVEVASGPGSVVV